MKRQQQPLAWRDGDRICGQANLVYPDSISNEQIRAQIELHRDDSLFVAFARAALAIREFEVRS